MMGGAGASPDTDHRWLAKVLAGDPVACWVLALARNLPDAELDALTLCVEQVGAGVPADVAATLRQERGLTPG